jgi:hypothetical protein
MAFKVRDLMINVIPQDVADLCGSSVPLHCGPTYICQPTCHCISNPITCPCASHPVTLCAFGSCPAATRTVTGLQGFFPCGCASHPLTMCTLGSCPNTTRTIPTRTGFDLSPEDSLNALSALKEQLKQQLAEVEKQQAAAAESTLPQTVEEVDMLTKKLNDALEELKVRRSELSKRFKQVGD